MDNLNWTWILIAVAILAFFFLRRGHGGFGHGSGGGFGHGHHGGHDRSGHDRDQNRPPPTPPEAGIDPVSGAAIPTAGAITSVHQGMTYFFASKENRDRFESAPEDYAGKTQGVTAGDSESAERPHHRHGGC